MVTSTPEDKHVEYSKLWDDLKHRYRNFVNSKDKEDGMGFLTLARSNYKGKYTLLSGGHGKSREMSVYDAVKNTVLLNEIDFHTCALNYKAEHKNASDYCIGERKFDELYFLFYTSGIKTKVVFKKHYVMNLLRYHLLKGSKASRFHSLQKLICETNFRTYDMS